MITRTTRRERLIRRARGRDERDGASPRLPTAQPAAEAEVPAGSSAERRDFDRAQDTAVYNCQCGMVFDAPVCTSVACPHCGETQAW